MRSRVARHGHGGFLLFATMSSPDPFPQTQWLLSKFFSYAEYLDYKFTPRACYILRLSVPHHQSYTILVCPTRHFLRVNDCSSTLRMDSQWPPSSSAIANTIPILNKVVNRSGVQRWIIQHWMRHPLLFPLRTGWMTALRRHSDSHFEQGG